MVSVYGTKKAAGGNSVGRNVLSRVLGSGSFAWLGLLTLLCGFPALAQSQNPQMVGGMETDPPGTQQAGATAGPQLPNQPSPGSISGTVVDRTGTAVAGAHIKLTREGQSPDQEAQAGEDGQFSFTNIPPGPFQLTFTSTGFATQLFSGTLTSEQGYVTPPITLVVATAITEVHVELSPVELAQEELKDQEKQRVLGVIPNFYVTYVPNAVPLSSKQKFQLAWKTTVDPVSFGVTGAVAGIEQAQNHFSGYGQGAEGYAKRYGAAYADFVTSTFIGGAILPSLLKQDPRYFYKGTGGTRSRILYAIANSVICKGDNGHWQANYSEILGSLASGGISNLYYPASDRNGAALTFENAAIGIGATAAINLLQEFVIRKLTPNVPANQPATP
jgi:Carboxypeptidase regulatory-like domain